MKKKLESILLIDDDESTNFLHRTLIQYADITKKIEVVNRADKALDYLKSLAADSPESIPQLIFLDINMPAMNGWEFLNEYARLDLPNKQDIKIIMLTASVNPNDILQAKTNVFVSEILHKPLSIDAVSELLPEMFPALA